MANIVLNARQCPASYLMDDQMNHCCQLNADHVGDHATYEGISFTEAQNWPNVYQRQIDEQRKINAELERKNPPMTRS